MKRHSSPLKYHQVVGGREHRIVVALVLGHSLPSKSVIHHVNDDKGDNRHVNLCVLQNSHEHKALHYRRKVLRAGGNPWTQRLCGRCGLRPIENFYPRRDRGIFGLDSNCMDCRKKLSHPGFTVEID